MKTFKHFFSLALTIGVSAISFSQNVGINTTGAVADPSAALDVSATDKGFLAPRVADTNAVTTPATGLIIYDNSCNCYRFKNNTKWSSCLNSSALSYNSSTGVLGFNDVNGVSTTVNLTSRKVFTIAYPPLSGTGLSGVPDGVMVHQDMFRNGTGGHRKGAMFYIENGNIYIIAENENDPSGTYGAWTGSGTPTITVALTGFAVNMTTTITVGAGNVLTYTDNAGGYCSYFELSATY